MAQSQIGYGKNFTHGDLVQFAFIDSEGFFEADVEGIFDRFAVLSQLNENLRVDLLNDFLSYSHAVVSLCQQIVKLMALRFFFGFDPTLVGDIAVSALNMLGCIFFDIQIHPKLIVIFGLKQMIVVIEAELFVDMIGGIADATLLIGMFSVEFGHFYQHILYVVKFL